MTLRMTALAGYVRWRYRARHDLDRTLRLLPTRQTAAPVPEIVARRCAVTRSTLLGRREMVTLAPRVPERGSPHVVHLHGGAYVYAIQERHWSVLAELVESSGATFHVPLYGLAPAATVDDALPLVDAAIAHARNVAGGAPVFLSGDSAGGGLALSQCVRMRDAGGVPVAGLLLFSPWVDAVLDNPRIARLRRRDPMLSREMLIACARMWAGDRDPADPAVSPLRADLSELPSVVTYVGGRDILLPDAERLDAAVRAAGGESVLRVWPSGFHVFMAALSTRESREVIADASARIRLASTS